MEDRRRRVPNLPNAIPHLDHRISSAVFRSDRAGLLKAANV